MIEFQFSKIGSEISSLVYTTPSAISKMVQEEQGNGIESKIQNVTPSLPHLVDLTSKCTLIKQLTTELLQKAEKDLNVRIIDLIKIF